MKTVNMHEAQTHLSRLVEAATRGEPFVIARAGKPLVEVRAIGARRHARAAALRLPQGPDRVGRRGGPAARPGDPGRVRGQHRPRPLSRAVPRRRRGPGRTLRVRLLLDTHLIVCAADDPARVPRRVRDGIAAAERLVFSVVTLWEVAIKVARGRSGIRTDPGTLRRGLLANGYEELPVLAPQALAVLGLPALHSDPFDRMLVAQARAENLILLTADRALAACGPPVHLV